MLRLTLDELRGQRCQFGRVRLRRELPGVLDRQESLLESGARGHFGARRFSASE